MDLRLCLPQPLSSELTSHLQREQPCQLLRLVVALPLTHRGPDRVDVENEHQWVIRGIKPRQRRLANPRAAVKQDEPRNQRIV